MERKRIVLVGPVYPFRGGISHYTGLMCRELMRCHDVTMISYKMQYPKFLFHKEQKDYENDSFKIDDTKYWIHTANPFNIIRVARKIKKCNPDMVIIQWWHPYFAPCYYLLTKFMGKQNVTFVCHNVFPHERFPMDKVLTRLVLKQGKHYVVHAKEEGNELLKITKEPDYRITPHPTYNAFQFENMSKEEARKRLGMERDEHMLLFFGFVREYKGLKILFHSMPELTARDDKIKLWIVGEFGSDKEEYDTIMKQLDMPDRIKVVDTYTPDREVEKYFAAADLVVLPYLSATQSGIVQIAYGFGKPVVVTEVGGLPDVVEDGRTGYVVNPNDSSALASAILRFFDENKEDVFIRNIEKEAYRFSWERMREVLEGFME